MQFPNYKPSQSTAVDREFKVKAVKFGDGYEQRAADGINNSPLIFNVVFARRTNQELSHIDAFLAAMGGVTAFDWNPPAPHDYANALLYSIATAYVGGDKAKDALGNVYVCIQANTGIALTNTDYWFFITRLPLKWVCRKDNWKYDEFNSNTISATFEQVFEA